MEGCAGRVGMGGWVCMCGCVCGWWVCGRCGVCGAWWTSVGCPRRGSGCQVCQEMCWEVCFCLCVDVVFMSFSVCCVWWKRCVWRSEGGCVGVWECVCVCLCVLGSLFWVGGVGQGDGVYLVAWVFKGVCREVWLYLFIFSCLGAIYTFYD